MVEHQDSAVLRPVNRTMSARRWMRAHWVSCVGVGAILVSMVAVTAWAEQSSRQSDLLSASAQARNVSRQLAERTNQFLSRAQQLSGLVALEPGRFRARDLLIEGPANSAVVFMDASGRVTDSTLAAFAKGTSASTSAYFQQARQAAPGRVALGEPMTFQPAGPLMLPAVRALHDASGQFSGAIVIALNATAAVGPVQMPTHPDAMFALVDGEGRILAGLQSGRRLSPTRIRGLDWLKLQRDSPDGVLPTLTGPSDRVQRLVALVPVSDYPLQVMTGVPISSATADARKVFQVIHFAVALICASVIGGTLLVQRQKHRLQEAFDLRGEAQAALNEEKEFLAVTLGSIDDGVVTLDAQQRVTFLNRRAEAMTGWATRDAQGQPVGDIVRMQEASASTETITGQAEEVADRIDASALRADAKGVARLVNRSGKATPVEFAVMALERKHSNTHSVLVLHDVSQATQMAHTLSYQAAHDPLTGLFNRTAFDAKVDEALASAVESEREHVLLFLDLDQFKVVNDTCGHAAGDELLKQVAFLFLQCLRQSDMLARMGGDEFAVLLLDCPARAALRLADKLRAELTAFRFAWDDLTFQVGVSIGAVAITTTSGNRSDLMRRADAACYIAKDAGRNRTHLYLDCDEAVVARHGEMSWAARVQRALADDEFVLEGQRIVSPLGGPGHYYEMLVRLQEPDGALVPPMAFLPAAERYGLMPAIDRAVIEKAMREHQVLQASTLENVKFGINLSGSSLSDPSLIKFIREVMERYQVPPCSICFELTETVAIANLQVAAKMMGELRSMGCTIALDDFGSGMSSFSYLKQFPVDVVKIDGSFVRNMLGNKVDYAMVESVNNIAHQMGLVTLAEYVESPELIAALQAMGVDMLQGYGVGKPESLAAMMTSVRLSDAARDHEGKKRLVLMRG